MRALTHDHNVTIEKSTGSSNNEVLASESIVLTIIKTLFIIL